MNKMLSMFLPISGPRNKYREHAMSENVKILHKLILLSCRLYGFGPRPKIAGIYNFTSECDRINLEIVYF